MKGSATMVALWIGLSAVAAHGQSSSLFVQSPEQVAQPQTYGDSYGASRRSESRLSPAIAQTSYSAVRLPEPRRFAVQDLVTIIIRESLETDFEASLDTEKESNFDGEIADFPRLSLRDLLNFQLDAGDEDDPNPRVGIDFGNEFEGEGGYSRRESITGRITARVIDVKPNGLLVLEARKFIQTDGETLNLVLTGTCRAEDVTIDNTILSTQLYDLRVDKQHTGELRRSTKKGILTRLFETIFNF